MLPIMQLILISRTLLRRTASREEIISKSGAERDLEADQQTANEISKETVLETGREASPEIVEAEVTKEAGEILVETGEILAEAGEILAEKKEEITLETIQETISVEENLVTIFTEEVLETDMIETILKTILTRTVPMTV